MDLCDLAGKRMFPPSMFINISVFRQTFLEKNEDQVLIRLKIR